MSDKISSEDLIRREWLKDAFDNLCCHNCKICRNFRNEDSFYKCALIENARAVERPQGKWVRTGQSFVNPNKFRNFCCSNCFWELDEHIRIEPNFCPNCGADMRGNKE